MTLSPISTRTIIARTGAASGRGNICGHQVYYEADGEGLPIVFLHDGLAHSIIFDAQFSAFSTEYTVIRYDRPGYGRSQPPATPYSDVSTLEGVFEYLGLERAILIGGSAGGRLALNFTLQHPGRVEELILVGAPVSGFDFSDHMRYRGWRNAWGDSIPEMIEFWTNDPWLVAEENQAARAYLRQLLTDSPHNLLSFPEKKPDGIQALPRLSEIQASTLIMIGEADIADNHAQAGVIQAGIKAAERQVVTRAGHLVYLEQPEVFNRIVLDFLKRRLDL